jgi:hypothetical protein
MHWIISTAMIAIITGIAPAQDDGGVIVFSDLKIGQQGYFPRQDDGFYFKVKEVIGLNQIHVYAAGLRTNGLLTTEWTRRDIPFVVRGVDTAGLGEESRVLLKGRFEVTETTKVGGQTVFVAQRRPTGTADDDKMAEVARPAPKVEPVHNVKAKEKKLARPSTEKPTAKEMAARAETKLSMARQLINDGKKDIARRRLTDILNQYPETSAAKEARQLLDEMK